MEEYILKSRKALVVGRCCSGVTTLCASIKQFFPNLKSVEEYNIHKYANLQRYVQRNGVDCVFILSRVSGDNFEGTSWGEWIENLPEFTALVFGRCYEPSLMNDGLSVLGEMNAQNLQASMKSTVNV